jgi:DNA-binding transcriptional regulator YiaG
VSPRCGHPMRRTERDTPVLQDPVCGRPSGHPGRHRSEASVRTMRARRKAAYDRPTGSPVVAAKIREAREQAGASQSLLAAVLGVTQQCVHDWEKARRAPSEESWEQLELTLGPLGVVRDTGPDPAEAGHERAA